MVEPGPRFGNSTTGAGITRHPSSQATSTVLLPDGSMLTAFGTGYRCQDTVKGQPAPRDVGLVKWRLNTGTLNTETKLRDAPFASDLRNVYNLIPCN